MTLACQELAHRSKAPRRAQLQLRFPPSIFPADEVPIEPLRRLAGRAWPPDWVAHGLERDIRVRLLDLCDLLDDLMDDRPVVDQTSPYGEIGVTLLGSTVYSVHPRARQVSHGTIGRNGYQASKFPFDVGHPLDDHDFLTVLVARYPMALDFLPPHRRDEARMLIDQWTAKSLYNLLRRRGDLRDLRRSLAASIPVPMDIMGIALASRHTPHRRRLDSRLLNRVWKYQDDFRRVARENPQLLPLLNACLEEEGDSRFASGQDPIHVLKTVLRRMGISEAGWRYVVHHGARLFRVPWQVVGKQPRLVVAVRWMKTLQAAGLPPPPPPSIARAMIYALNPHGQGHIALEPDFHDGIHPLALRAGLLEADRRRHAGTVADFLDEFLSVLLATDEMDMTLDANQAKAGWRWWVRQRDVTNEFKRLVARSRGQYWPMLVQRFESAGLTVVPLATAVDLIEEGLALHNCLVTSAVECLAGRLQVYSVRDAQTTKRLGCIGFRFRDGDVSLPEVKGFANLPPNDALLRAGGMLYDQVFPAWYGASDATAHAAPIPPAVMPGCRHQ